MNDRNDAVEANSIVKPLVNQSNEVFARFGGMLIVQFQHDPSLSHESPLQCKVQWTSRTRRWSLAWTFFLNQQEWGQERGSLEEDGPHSTIALAARFLRFG